MQAKPLARVAFCVCAFGGHTFSLFSARRAHLVHRKRLKPLSSFLSMSSFAAASKASASPDTANAASQQADHERALLPASTLPERLAECEAIMDQVYGAFGETKSSASASSSSSSSSASSAFASAPPTAPAASAADADADADADMKNSAGDSKSHDRAWKPRAYKEGKGRYLWTDAFGVVNYLTLFTQTGRGHFLQQAQRLIEEVHNTLGKERRGKRRLGSATDERPTLGGLRIGKPDEEGEEDGDGQYFHYLTKWMFALNRASLVTGDGKYNAWAVDMAAAVHPHFVARPSAGASAACPRMFWKISIDLTYPHIMSGEPSVRVRARVCA